jgi:non-specific serine/threonine protein kinase
LGVREEPGRPITATLLDWLRAKQLLLLLDNCEHLIDACAQFADSVLHSAPDVKLLATSREALGIAGERAFQVPSLEIPNPHPLQGTYPQTTLQIPIHALAQLESVQLFVDRAQAVQATFQLTDTNASAVTQICQRLDGIPLAIELAAARVKAMRVEQVAERLQSRFLLLTGGSRTALRRQQTLRSAIDWSHNLLTEPERVLLRRLAVFAGGWTLEAAEAVGSSQSSVASSQQIHKTTDDWLLPTDILDVLTHLVDKSLVLLDEESVAPRYRMLETIREYALEKLAESGESAAVRTRHLNFFVQFAEAFRRKMQGGQSNVGLVQAETELDNFRIALDWSLHGDDVTVGVRLASALVSFYNLQGYQNEGLQWWMTLLAQPSALQPTEARVIALRSAASFQFIFGNFAQARDLNTEALALARALDHQPAITDTLRIMSRIAAAQGQHAEADACGEEALRLARALGDRWRIATALYSIGEVALSSGQYPHAQRAFEESIDEFKQLGGSSLQVAVHRQLGYALFHQQDYRGAATQQQASLKLSVALESKTGVASALAAFGDIAVINGDLLRAARLCSAAMIVLETTASRQIHLPVDRIEYERTLTTLRAQLSESDFNAAWEAGRTLTLEQAIELALQAPPEPPVPPPHSPALKAAFGGLTAREREVAALVAQGMTNREIAEKLVVGERTVESHVSSILSKLGFTERAQVRQWAKEKGLK